MTEAQGRGRVWFDHFVIGVSELSIGVDEFEGATGVRPSYGGAHPGLGTHNALVSLGQEAYLEVIAPQPGATVTAPFLTAAMGSELTPAHWAVATNDLPWVQETLRAAGFAPGTPSPGGRETPDGQTIRWTTLFLEEAPIGAPFFISWDNPEVHPSRTTPAGCSLDSFTVATDEPDTLAALFAAIGFDTPIVEADGWGMEIALGSPNGPFRLGGS